MTSAPVEPVKILLVEDNDDDFVMLQESLFMEPFIQLMHIVKDGQEAMTYLHHEGVYANVPRPDLVLLDLNLPKKNGFDVLMEIRQDPDLQRIPVIIFTTSHNEEDVIRAYSSGACSFITKPLNFAKLRESMHHFANYWALVARLPTNGEHANAHPAH